MAKKDKALEEVQEVKKPLKKMYKASITERVGSNPDGSTKYNFNKGKEIELTLSEAKNLKKYLE